jgi:quercetin dioxygenase-like cupin family protein
MKRILKDEIILSESSKTIKVLANPSFKMIGLGFKKGQALEKHTTSTKAILIVQFGEVEFLMDEVKYNLQAGVFFEIPENVEHEVHALADSYLYLIK